MPSEIEKKLNLETVKRLFLYDPETGFFFRKMKTNNSCKTGVRTGNYRTKSGYRSISIGGVNYLEHRVAWFIFYGRWPVREIDHIDMDKSNNKISNLREATPSQNGMNKSLQKNNKSGARGVFWVNRDKRWCARITSGGRIYRLGYFTSFEDAVKVREQKEAELFGEFRRKYAV